MTVELLQSVEELCRLKTSVKQQVAQMEDKVLLVTEGLGLLDRYVGSPPGGQSEHDGLSTKITGPWGMAHWVYALKAAGYKTPDERHRIRVRYEFDDRLTPGTSAYQIFWDKLGVLLADD